jgi:hypothetical protein
MIIAVDFDGTIVEHTYPKIGKELPFAVETLKQLAADGHKLILWTVRHGQRLDEALKWCNAKGLYFYAVNSNVPLDSLFTKKNEESRKIQADIFIDDSNLGGLPDWGEIYGMVCEMEGKKRAHKGRSSRKRGWLSRLWKR